MASPEKKTISWKTIVLPNPDDLSGRIAWIDFLKGVSMIAVVMDHLFYKLGKQTVAVSIQPLTFFSVSMFIFLAGITAALSYDRHRDAGLKGALRRLPHILVPYAIATAVFLFYESPCDFEFLKYWDKLLHFSASPPFYFVFFFSQLMLISPLLYWAFCVSHKWDWFVLPFSFVIVAVVSFWCTFCTEMLPLHGGGSRLFGGFFLIFFALGFLFFRFRVILQSLPSIFVFAGAFIPLYILFNLFWRDDFYKSYELGLSANPPGLYFFLYTFMIFWGVLFVFKLIDFTRLSKYTNPIAKTFDFLIAPIQFCGKHSLMIFLYHMLAIELLATLIKYVPVETNFTLKLLYGIFGLVFATVFPLIFVLLGHLWERFILFLSNGRSAS